MIKLKKNKNIFNEETNSLFYKSYIYIVDSKETMKAIYYKPIQIKVVANP